MYQLAESYRLYFDYGNAEKYYAQAVQFDSARFPLTRYWYGVCLRANKNYTAAEEQLTLFLNSYTTAGSYRDNAIKELNNVRFIRQQLRPGMRNPVSITKVSPVINRDGANYAPVWYNDSTFIFTSSRADSTVLNSGKEKNPFYNNLYMSVLTPSGFSEPVKLTPVDKDDWQEGVSAYTPDRSRMFITEWIKTQGKNTGAIYVSERQGASWTTPVKLNGSVNVEGYSSIQPFVTDDGKYMFFASDRPGGMGKYDIWCCPLDASGMPGNAIHLGTIINTKEDDEAPFYHTPSRTIVVASNGRTGMGGFDLYQSRGDLTGWSEPQNLGFPVNDVKDDIYFTTKGKQFLLSDAYISSDRNSVCCLEIYSIQRTLKHINGQVVECGTNQPLAGAHVTLLDTVADKVLLSEQLGSSAWYSIETEEFMPVKIIAEKQGYITHTSMITPGADRWTDTLFAPSVCLSAPKQPYPVNRPVILEGIYYDFDKATLRPESYPVLDTLASVLRMYPDMALQLGAHTDGKGSVDYNLGLSEARAQSCVDYLVSRGIALERLVSKGYGKCCPVAPNTLPNGKDNPDGRQLNRRTEFTVLHY